MPDQYLIGMESYLFLRWATPAQAKRMQARLDGNTLKQYSDPDVPGEVVLACSRLPEISHQDALSQVDLLVGIADGQSFLAKTN